MELCILLLDSDICLKLIYVYCYRINQLFDGQLFMMIQNLLEFIN